MLKRLIFVMLVTAAVAAPPASADVTCANSVCTVDLFLPPSVSVNGTVGNGQVAASAVYFVPSPSQQSKGAFIAINFGNPTTVSQSGFTQNGFNNAAAYFLSTSINNNGTIQTTVGNGVVSPYVNTVSSNSASVTDPTTSGAIVNCVAPIAVGTTCVTTDGSIGPAGTSARGQIAAITVLGNNDACLDATVPPGGPVSFKVSC